jgi:hypothetical protein
VKQLWPPAIRSGTAACLALALLTLGSATGHSLNGATTTVTITAVSGYAGHAFVYARVTNSTGAYPAPTGTGHQSPYFSDWIAQPLSMPSCPWVWAVYVFDRATNAQLNAPPPTAPTPNFGTTTIVCASPTSTPVDQPPQADAAARLDLDLSVSIAPAQPVAGSTSVVSAVLSSALTRDLNLYLSMAIEDWSVTRWSVDFGDGQSASMTGPLQSRLNVPHTYRVAGRYDAKAVAAISGHAQAAIYDRFGAVRLVQRNFSVEVGNDTLATVRRPPSRTYLPAQAFVGVSPALGSTATGPTAFRHVDALRGAFTTFAVRLVIVREGVMFVDGVPSGWGQSRLMAWRYDGSVSDAPTGSGTRPGSAHNADQALRLQWNAPDRLAGSQPQDYVVPVTIIVQTRYPDGHLASYAIASSFTVSVNFAAESG